MSEIDESVLAAMRQRAERPVDVETLLVKSRRSGIRRRRVRLGLGAGVVAAAMAAATFGVGAVLPGAKPPTTEIGVEPSASPSAAAPSTAPAPADGLARLPSAAAPGAGANLLRLDVADPQVRSLIWVSGPGWELLEVGRKEGWSGAYQSYHVAWGETAIDLNRVLSDVVTAGRPPVTEQISVGGASATLRLIGDGRDESRHAVVTLQLAGGWYAVIVSFLKAARYDADADRTAAVRAAGWLRTDLTYRCQVDFRLAWIPPGSKIAGCHYAVAESFLVRGLVLRDGTKSVRIYTTAASLLAPYVPNAFAGDKRVVVNGASVRYAYGERGVDLEPGPEPFPAQDVLRIAAGFSPAELNDDPLR